MAARSSLDDMESNASEPIQRTPKTYRTTPLPLEPPVNIPDTQMAFRELQSELETFLKEHLNKIRDLQASISSSTDHAMTHSGHGTVMSPGDRRSVALHPPDISFPIPVVDTASQYDIGVKTPQRRSFVAPKPIQLDTQAQAIQAFLKAHAENIQNLQNMLQGHPEAKTNATLYHHHSTKSSISEGMDFRQFDSFCQQFLALLMTSTLSIISVIVFLSLVHIIIGSTRKVIFSIGMLFGFFSLLMHIGNAIIAGRAVANASVHEKHCDRYYFKLKSVAWQQLQFAASILFLLSIFILSFSMFISVAFPVVVLILFIIGSSIIFWSMYLEISITLDNIAYLTSNVQHLRQSLEYLRIRGRAIANKGSD